MASLVRCVGYLWENGTFQSTIFSRNLCHASSGISVTIHIINLYLFSQLYRRNWSGGYVIAKCILYMVHGLDKPHSYSDRCVSELGCGAHLIWEATLGHRFPKVVSYQPFPCFLSSQFTASHCHIVGQCHCSCIVVYHIRRGEIHVSDSIRHTISTIAPGERNWLIDFPTIRDVLADSLLRRAQMLSVEWCKIALVQFFLKISYVGHLT